MPNRSVTKVALDQIDVWWGWFVFRVQGLSDDEYFWEPVPGCWTVRQQSDGRYSADPWPAALWPPPSPPPVTTIAWRLVHMIQGPMERMRKYGFAEPGPSPSASYEGWPGMGAFDPAECPRRATDAIAQLTESFEAWRNAIARMDEEDAWTPLGDGEGIEMMRLGEADPFLNVVQHLNREYIHHGAEVALLRDLWRAQH